MREFRGAFLKPKFAVEAGLGLISGWVFQGRINWRPGREKRRGENMISFPVPLSPLIKTGTSILAISPMGVFNVSILGEPDKNTWEIVSILMTDFAIRMPRVLLGLTLHFDSEIIIFLENYGFQYLSLWIRL